MNTAKIKELRLSLKLTQEQASQRASLGGAQRWNNIERGRVTNIKVATLEAIAKALGVKAADLLK